MCVYLAMFKNIERALLNVISLQNEKLVIKSKFYQTEKMSEDNAEE